MNALTGRAEPNRYVLTNTGMSGVVPAWKIQEILDRDDIQKIIAEETDKLIAKERGYQAELDSLAHARPEATTTGQVASDKEEGKLGSE